MQFVDNLFLSNNNNVQVIMNIYNLIRVRVMKKVKITITGRVHDVGYRPFLLDLADSLLIERFDARNVVIEGKQAVIVLVEGNEDQVNQFIELIKENKPENAVVEEIKVEDYDGFIRTIDSYRNSLMVSQLNKIVHVGLKMLEKQDLMLQKQDLMLQKQDETIKEIKVIGTKIDDLSRKMDETKEYLGKKIDETKEYLGAKIDNVSKKVEDTKEYLGEKIDKVGERIDSLRMDLREYFNQRLRKIEEEIEKIKLKLGMV